MKASVKVQPVEVINANTGRRSRGFELTVEGAWLPETLFSSKKQAERMRSAVKKAINVN